MLRRTWTIAATATLLALTPSGWAQSEQAGEGEPRPLVERLEELEPARRLGARAALGLHVRKVIPDVVIVPDAGSYLEAIGEWGKDRFWPVLIDDGSFGAREDIARFVRAFEPRAVVRWKTDRDSSLAWPDKQRRRREAIERALARAWDFDERGGTTASFTALMKGAGLVPPGLVLTSTNDAAWPGGVALASGRAQPIAWVNTRRGIGAAFNEAQATDLVRELELAADLTGLAWRAMGDDLDAVTLALNCPARVRAGDGDDGRGDFLATTDVLGRAEDSGERWAWVGQVAGSESRSAYAAMCGLFLSPERAWLFDGYPEQAPFTHWDATRAAGPLQARGLEVQVIDSPGATAMAWEASASDALDAGLVMVNTRGNRDFFDLNPGRRSPGDVPLLDVPTMCYIVHSWSAANLAARGTVGGRWLAHGAYAYLGSVQEPYLQAFVPTPTVAARLASGYPWAAAVRTNEGPPWKLACVGDPLITLAPPPERVEDALPLAGAEDVEERMREALEEERFEDGLGALVLLGQDKDVAKLVEALLDERPEAMTPEVARLASLALFRAGRQEGLRRVLSFAGDLTTAHGDVLDALWLSAGSSGAGANGELVGLLRANLRPDQPGQDALHLAPAVERLFGPEVAASLLRDALSRERSQRVRRDLERAMREMR